MKREVADGVANLGALIPRIADAEQAADAEVWAETFDAVWGQAIGADLRTEIPVPVNRDADAAAHHDAAEGSAITGRAMVILAEDSANIEEGTDAAAALDAESSANKVGSADKVGGVAAGRAARCGPVGVFGKQAEATGAEKTGFHAELAGADRPAAGFYGSAAGEAFEVDTAFC